MTGQELCRRSSLVKDYQIAALLIDSSDNLWLSPYGKGLVGYDRTKKEICRLHASRDLSNGIILDIKEREGKLLAGYRWRRYQYI